MKLQIEACSEDWKAMPGDDRTRTCARCAKQVHDLAALTTREARELIARDRPCVRAIRRRDGTIVTRLAAAALAVAGCAVEPAIDAESPDAGAEIQDAERLIVDLFPPPAIDDDATPAERPRFDLEYGAFVGVVRALEFTAGDPTGPEEYDPDKAR
jgi:hypothetical protein